MRGAELIRAAWAMSGLRRCGEGSSNSLISRKSHFTPGIALHTAQRPHTARCSSVNRTTFISIILFPVKPLSIKPTSAVFASCNSGCKLQVDAGKQCIGMTVRQAPAIAFALIHERDTQRPILRG